MVKVHAPMGISVSAGWNGWPTHVPFRKILSRRIAGVRKQRCKNPSRSALIFLIKLDSMIRAEIRSVKSLSMRPRPLPEVFEIGQNSCSFHLSSLEAQVTQSWVAVRRDPLNEIAWAADHCRSRFPLK